MVRRTATLRPRSDLRPHTLDSFMTSPGSLSYITLHKTPWLYTHINDTYQCVCTLSYHVLVKTCRWTPIPVFDIIQYVVSMISSGGIASLWGFLTSRINTLIFSPVGRLHKELRPASVAAFVHGHGVPVRSQTDSRNPLILPIISGYYWIAFPNISGMTTQR